ncbi:amidohydrolase [Allorhizocola rhizosphaerae]|uniref:amidohydrolase n=1 Tax=Allorhizocola rhizosphaerae TaxID=1872709 RepID=UPI000E3D3DA6|nr:amidohydrolase [Allorhizocola rhizosphaerae]
MTIELAGLYKHLHANPELAYAERETAALAAKHARELGYEVTEGVGGTGVVALLRNGPGPVVLLRADMDALPVHEETGLGYASTRPGLMHACGHDMHVTWLLGALEELAEHAPGWNGTVMAVFQPAEENGGGAQAMVDDGLFERFPMPSVALGQHLVNLPAGTVGYRAGNFMAASDAVRVKLFGRGGHGSRPETTVDPVVMAAATVLRLQTIVAREIGPLDTAVVTVGSMHAGSAANIIAPDAELLLSVRSFNPAVREAVLASIERIVKAEALASGAPVEPQIVREGGYPVLHNDSAATAKTVAALGRALGTRNVIERQPVMGSEDFGNFGRAAGVPSCFWFVGGCDPQAFAAAAVTGRLDIDIPSNHSPHFAPVLEPTLRTGVDTMVAAARAWLADGNPAS